MTAVPVARMSIHMLWVASCIVAAPTSTDFLAKADNSRRNGPTCITNWCTSYGATTNEDLPKNCIRRPPLHKIKRRDSFWVLKGGWDSVDVMSSLVKILMQDVLGYENIMLESGAWEHDWEPIRSMGGPGKGKLSAAGRPLEVDSSTGRNKNLCSLDGDHGRCFMEMDRGDGVLQEYGPDVYMEHWSAGYEQIDNMMFFQEQTVVPLGPVGYFGTVGMYATSVSTQLADGCSAYWTRYKTVEDLTSFLTSFSTNNPGWDYRSASPYSCGARGNYTYDWCNAGRFIPPQCENNRYCVDVVMNRPYWEKSMFEQIVTNLNLNLTLVYVGPTQWVNEMTAAVNASRQQLFYDFFPTVTTAQLDISRVSLPEYVPSQHASDASNPNAAYRWQPNGTVASDFPDNILTKVVSAKLRDDAPDAYQLIGALQMKKTYIVDILRQLRISGNTDSDYHKQACDWLRNNSAVWKSWVPRTTCHDGYQYHIPTNKCVPLPPDEDTTDITGILLAVIIPFVAVFVAFLIWFLFYRKAKIQKSRMQKSTINTMQKQLEESLVNVKVVTRNYIPASCTASWQGASCISSSQSGRRCEVATPLGPVGVSIDMPSHTLYPDGQCGQWYWEETEAHMAQHNPADVIDRRWVRYLPHVEAQLDQLWCTATPGQLKSVTIQQGSNSVEYDIDFFAQPMTQTKRETGFKRSVRRLPAAGIADSVTPPQELSDETHLVLPKDALIQISKQGPDGWAFGNVMYSPEDVDPALGALVHPDSNLSLVGGWFPLAVTTAPTQEDLSKLSGLMGGMDAAGCLAQPASWTTMKSTDIAECTALDAGSPERARVEAAFKATLNTTVRVLGVDRVQNLAMWQSYAVKRQTILTRDNELPPASLERIWLFHGTNVEVADKIVQQGFNRSFCGKNATMYGKGVYFARDASYSSSTTYSIPDRNAVQHMFACRVTVGQCCRGKQNALTPDIRQGLTLYDSTTDTSDNPAIYVTYHDAQAYPEYLIHFKSSN